MLKTHLSAVVLACVGAVLVGFSRPSGRAPARAPETIAKVLDDFHDAAAKADQKRYFGHFADNAVFLGTDASERWTKAQFLTYAKPFFDQGRGWTYFPRDGARHITISDDGKTAWFDEALDNAKYGLCRGTGVLTRAGDDWRIAQYNLTVPVPNDLLDEVVSMIRKAAPKPGK